MSEKLRGEPGPFSEQSEQKEKIRSFVPITAGRLIELKKQLTGRVGVDFSTIPTTVSRPGEFYFDLYEAQTKLYKKMGWRNLADELKSQGYDFQNIPKDADQKMRNLAEKNDVILDGTMDGFVYNIGGHHIIYMGIKPEQVVPMAKKYARKEGLNESIIDTNEKAREYLSELSEKYFYHELGHTIYLYLLTPQEQADWDKTILEQPELAKKVEEAQRDKHPDINSIPIGNEAFADIFSSVVTNGKIKNRLGKQSRSSKHLAQILRQKGFQNI